MGSDPRHRAPARERRPRPVAGRRKAERTSTRVGTGSGRPHLAGAIVAGVATVGAVVLGTLSTTGASAPPTAAIDPVRPAVAADGGTAARESERARERAVDERLLSGTLSRSATRATSGTTNRVPGWLEGCRRTPQTLDSPNGQIPEEDLCELPDGFLLRGDAAAAWSRLASSYERRFGTEVCMTDAYRDLGSQQRLAAIKPGLAARPGTSNHGWGVAVDLCGGVERFDSEQHRWFSENAGGFGWVNPGWAREHGSRPEPWHWEYIGTP